MPWGFYGRNDELRRVPKKENEVAAWLPAGRREVAGAVTPPVQLALPGAVPADADAPEAGRGAGG